MPAAQPPHADPRELERHLASLVARRFPPGSRIDDFEVRGRVVQGGMGLCIPVVDGFKRECLLKMLRPNLHARYSPPLNAADMLVQEAGRAAMLAAVDSDAFAQVYGALGSVQLEVDDDQGHAILDLPYYVMQRLSGTNLETIIAGYQKKLRAFIPWSNVLSIAHHVSVALGIAHEHGIIHRDLKPNNIYVHRRAFRKSVIKIIDFGISAEEGSQRLGSTGTARHMPPEFSDPNIVAESKTSDIYSLGLLIYELTVLRGPFDDDVIGVPAHRQREAFALAHRTTAPPSLTTFRRDAPDGLAALVARMLQKRQADRPPLPEIIDTLAYLLSGLGPPPDSQLADMLDTVGASPARRDATARQSPREYISAPIDERPIISEVFQPNPVTTDVLTTTAPSEIAASQEAVATPEPASSVAEDPSVRIFRSTAEIFDSSSLWADDVYMASPFETTDVDASPGPRPVMANALAPALNESMPGAVVVPSNVGRVRAARRKALARTFGGIVALGALGVLGVYWNANHPGGATAATEATPETRASLAAVAPIPSGPSSSLFAAPEIAVPTPPSASVPPKAASSSVTLGRRPAIRSVPTLVGHAMDIQRTFPENTPDDAASPASRVEATGERDAGTRQSRNLDDLNSDITH